MSKASNISLELKLSDLKYMDLTRKIYQRLWIASDSYISSNIYFRKLTIIVLLLSVILAIITGGRFFGIDRDYFQYLEGFSEVSQGYSIRWEPLFTSLVQLTQSIFGFDSFQIFLLIVAFISITPKLLILSTRDYFPILLFIYLLLILPLHEMTQIRVGMATAFAYWGLYSATFLGAGPLKRIIYVCVSIGFHYSTILMAPFILIPRIFQQRSVFFIFIIGAVPAIFFAGIITFLSTSSLIPDYMGALLSYYTDANLAVENAVNLFSVRTLILGILALIGLLNLRSIPLVALPWLYVSIFGFVVFISISQIPTIAHRLLELTIFSNLIWVTLLHKKVHRILSLGLLSLLAVYSSYLFFSGGYFGS